MEPSKLLGCTVLVAVLAAALLLSAPAGAAAAQALVLSRTIALPAVQGRLDHAGVDLDGERLFVAGLGAGSVEVIDLRGGTRVARIVHLREPQGVAYLAEAKHLVVAEGGGAQVDVFDGPQRIAEIGHLEDADNLRFDPAAERLYVGYGSALAVLDPATMGVVRHVALAGHPEAFVLALKGPQIYVNVPSAREIAVVDRNSGKVDATWPVTGAAQNFPMALDEPQHRLFVATRQPAMLLVYDTASGRRITAFPICGDADDLFFDSERRQLYAICGEGAVDVVRQRDADRYELAERVQTSPGARTGLFVPSLATLFVAVPARNGSQAEIRAYRAR